jgi:ribose/xylose/arabinose/galactoside ABC-type transport system permease subunit
MSDAEAPSPSQQMAGSGRSSLSLLSLLSYVGRSGSLYFGLIILFVAGCALSPAFLTTSTQGSVLRQVSQNGLLAVGMTLVILTGGIDLSVGRMLGFGSVLAAMLLTERTWTAAAWFAVPAAAISGGILLAILLRKLITRDEQRAGTTAVGLIGFVTGAGLLMAWTVPQIPKGMSIVAVLIVVPLAGFLLGSLSGIVITKCRLQPFIVTLAMMITAYGASCLIASGGGKGAYVHQVYDQDVAGMDWLRRLDPHKMADALWMPGAVRSLLRTDAAESVFDLIPVPGLLFLLCLFVGMFVLNRLRFGRYIYAIGGNEETARLSGIGVDRVKITVYAVSGMLAFLAGVFYCAQYRQGTPESGEMGELEAIAAVVVGGTSLMGGRGRMMGTLVGVLIFGYLTKILSLRGLHTDVQHFITGVIIVAAVLLQEGYFVRLAGRLKRR